jgi:alkylhydroperoxidase family enzyme
VSRLPLVPLPPEDPDVAEVFQRFVQERREPIALYRMLAHAPRLLKGYSGLANSLRHEAQTPRELRELVILRIAQLTGSAYEWSHHREMAAAAGVEEGKVGELASWRTSAAYDPRERAALRCAEEVHELALSDEGFAELQAAFTPPQVVELVLLAAFYEAVARVIQGLGVEVEAGYRPRLADFRPD